MHPTTFVRRAGSAAGTLLLALLTTGCGATQPAQVPTTPPVAVVPTNISPTSAPTMVPPTSVPTQAPALSEPTTATASVTESTSDNQQIVDTTAAYMRDTPATAYGVIIEGVEGDYAHTTAVPIDFDTTTVFLKREQGAWKVLSAGTDFSSEGEGSAASLGVPASIREVGAEHDMNEALVTAAATYVRSQNANLHFHIQQNAIDGDYARVQSMPDNPNETDPAWVFLKRDQGTWKGLVLGTAFGPDDYKALGIPSSLEIKVSDG